jgi:hypothetical protein
VGQPILAAAGLPAGWTRLKAGPRGEILPHSWRGTPGFPELSRQSRTTTRGSSSHPFGPALRFQATVPPAPQEGPSAPNPAPGHPPAPDCGVLEARSFIAPGLAGLAKRLFGPVEGELWYAGGKTTGATGPSGCSGRGAPGDVWPAVCPGRRARGRRRWPANHSRARLCGSR